MALEIFFCNLTVLDKKKEIIHKRVVYKDVNGMYKGNNVLKIDVICSLGFENTNKEFIEISKSDEKRNNITGTYE